MAAGEVKRIAIPDLRRYLPMTGGQDENNCWITRPYNKEGRHTVSYRYTGLQPPKEVKVGDSYDNGVPSPSW